MSFKIIPYNNVFPKIENGVYIADNCILAGAISVGECSSIWFNSVLRADVDTITIGKNTNIQDGTVIHTSRFDGPVKIGNNVTIGHLALIHACTLHDNAFIGMRATVMDKAIVEEFGFVGAGSLLTPNKVVKSKELWIGSPAKFIRYLTSQELEQMEETTKLYVNLARSYVT